jgi:putative transposase
VVDRRFVFGVEERERFRMFMRIQETFTGCRVLAYCVMSNHFHLLLEVPPMPAVGLSDEELLRRIGAANPEMAATVSQELARAREAGNDAWALQIHERFTYRMHNLSEFMKTLLQRFTRWFNSKHDRCGTLWEGRFKSVIVESGIAARTMAAYIDLNPVRAGMVDDPAVYRWSSYGEAVGGGSKGNGKKAREGLVRACSGHEGAGFDAGQWNQVSRIYRRLMGMALERNGGRAVVETGVARPQMNAEEALAGNDNGTVLPDLKAAGLLLCRVRYFSDGAVIGSKAFVDEVFASARQRFSARRKDGARKMRGNGEAAAGVLWSMRDLRVRV